MKILSLGILLTTCSIAMYSNSAISKSYSVEKNGMVKNITSFDTSGKFQFTSTTAVSCDKSSCFKETLDKINSFSKSSYILAYKNSSNEIVMEKDPSKYKSHLTNVEFKKIHIAEGNITVKGTKYPDQKYLVLVY